MADIAPSRSDFGTSVNIKPIETHYAGCRFRSRLEARWAVVFGKLRLKWEYEHEGYTVNGRQWLPDFLVRDWNCLVEIKPSFEIRRHHIYQAAAAGLNRRVLLIAGSPSIYFAQSRYTVSCFHPDGSIDEPMRFGACRHMEVWLGSVGGEAREDTEDLAEMIDRRLRPLRSIRLGNCLGREKRASSPVDAESGNDFRCGDNCDGPSVDLRWWGAAERLGNAMDAASTARFEWGEHPIA